MKGQEIIDFINENKMNDVDVSVVTSYKGNGALVLNIKRLSIECTELNMFIDVEPIDSYVENESCRACDWYDAYEGSSCENPERSQCIDHSLFEPRNDIDYDSEAKK